MGEPRSGTDPAVLLSALREHEWRICTAESLTAGLLVARIVDVPGASVSVEGGVCTYSFESKSSILGLDLADLESRGAVRPDVALAMAHGARRLYGADVALATTGVAGPGADPYAVPEGTAFVACVSPHRAEVRELHLTGSRAEVRAGVVDEAVALATEVMGRESTPVWSGSHPEPRP